MKIITSILSIAPALLLIGCAASNHYRQTAAYQEPATAPLVPTGHSDERVYSRPAAPPLEAPPGAPAETRETRSPAVIVEPSGAETTAGDLAIGDAIRRSFEADGDLSPSLRQMIISVHGGTVRLMGPVSNKEDEQAVLDKLRAIPGVSSIRDELQVRPTLQ